MNLREHFAMAKKQAKPAGRPKEPEAVKSLVSLKGTVAFEEWLDGFVEHSHQGTRALLLRNALRVFAEQEGYKAPPKR